MEESEPAPADVSAAPALHHTTESYINLNQSQDLPEPIVSGGDEGGEVEEVGGEEVGGGEEAAVYRVEGEGRPSGTGDESNSTISTMETADTDFHGVKLEAALRSGDDESGEEVAHIQGDPATIDWLNNQVAVAISSGVLAVTCKKLAGELHLDRFGSGNRGKCIEAYGQHFTPTEFEAFAGRAQCKDWKRSIRFHGRPLLQLIELDVLKVHAVSCTCAACWNGESSGEVRLHDIKRKTSAFTGTGRRPGLPRAPSAEGPVDEPLLKHIRLEVNKAKPPDSTPAPADSAPQRAALIRSPGGTLKIIQPQSHQGQHQQMLTAQTSTGQTLTLLVPSSQIKTGVTASTPIKIQASPTKLASGQKVTYIPVKKTTEGGTSGIPLGITYAPVTIMGSQSQGHTVSASSSSTSTNSDVLPAQPNATVTIISPELSEQWNVIHETMGSLEVELNSLRSMVASAKSKSERALQQLYAQTQASMGQELRQLRNLCRTQEAELGKRVRGGGAEAKYCLNCNRPARMACGDCQDAFYCGDFCVRRDSAAHRLACCPKPPSTTHTHTID